MEASNCPRCGSSNVYIGLAQVECLDPKCGRHPNQTPTLPAPSTDSYEHEQLPIPRAVAPNPVYYWTHYHHDFG